MKRFAVVSLAVLAVGAFGLSACGGGEKVKELEGQVSTLTTKNAELEAKGAAMQKELDECKAAAAAAAATPAPVETGKPTGTKAPVKTPAKATPTPAPATPTPVPTVPPDVKVKLKIK